jgi:branched-subunit amino acid transport protein AzlD
VDTVLIGGIGFLILVGLCFLIIKKIDNSSINDRNKRILNYLVLGLLVIITILIFKWHSSTYLISG